jgi:phage terminase Nu1 subunit (DNA packaging protein)
MATQHEVAKHLGISQKLVGDMVAMGHIEKQDRGQYDLDECRRQYIKRLQDMAAGRAAAGDLDLAEERARLAKEQADAKEMENAVARGELVSIEDVAVSIEKQFTKVRTKLLGIPTKVAPEAHACATVKEVQAIVEQAIIEALNDLVGIDERDSEE